MQPYVTDLGMMTQMIHSVAETLNEQEIDERDEAAIKAAQEHAAGGSHGPQHVPVVLVVAAILHAASALEPANSPILSTRQEDRCVDHLHGCNCYCLKLCCRLL